MTILVIAAHPDDEVLGCGGTIARYANENDVHVAILGEGVSSRYEQRTDVPAAQLQKLQADAKAAADVLGARSVSFCGLPDNRFDEVGLLNLIKPVEKWVETFRPDTIYTHHPGDLNIDHSMTFRAVLTATRPDASRVSVPNLYTFEVPSSTDWAFNGCRRCFGLTYSWTLRIPSTVRSPPCSATKVSDVKHHTPAHQKRCGLRLRGGAPRQECRVLRPSS